jgi:ABC-2 type transport system ATP-binding protein
VQYKIIDHSETARENHLKVQFLNGNSNNELLKNLMPVAEIIAFEEVIPSMNEVFIKAVEKANK